MRIIYAIRDRVANDLAGYFPLVVFRTDAQAVRYFTDSLAQEKSSIAAHPNDYELIECGFVEDDGTTWYHRSQDNKPAAPRIVITGSALVAAQTPQLVAEA